MGRLGALPACFMAIVIFSSMMGMMQAQDISNCTSTISDLESCLQFVLGTENNPSSSCCGNLRTAINSSRSCVCQIVEYGLNNTLTGQISQINLTLVQDLPNLCNINASLADCGISLNSTASPPSSPQGESPPTSSSHSNDAGALLSGSNLSIGKFALPAVFSAILLFVFAPDLMELLKTS